MHITQMVRIYLKLVATALIWGGTFIAGRIAVQTIGPFSVAFLRFAIASLSLLLIIWQVHGHIPSLKPQQRWAVLGLGLTGIFGYNALFFGGLQTVEAGRASLIIALNPVAIALGSAVFLKESLSWRQAIGIVISLIGAAWVITRGSLLDVSSLGDRFGWGEVMMIGCVLSWMSYTLIGKVVMSALSPLVASAYACWVGTALLLPAAWAEGLWQGLPRLQFSTFLSALYLGVLGSAVGFCWYYDGIRAIGPARASVFINLVPVSAISLAALLLNESLTPSLAVGATLVILGVSVTNRA